LSTVFLQLSTVNNRHHLNGKVGTFHVDHVDLQVLTGDT